MKFELDEQEKHWRLQVQGLRSKIYKLLAQSLVLNQ
jgi:hypothetical protein